MSQVDFQGRHIAIVGAGVIGSSCAAQLVLQGAKVTLIDRAMPGMAGPSRGNAAHIAAPEIIPMATPGIVISAIGMLLDPKSPLKIPLSHWPLLLPWIVRFTLNSQQTIHAANIEKLANINKTVFEDVESLYKNTGIEHLLRRDGALYLYETPKSLQNAAAEFETRRKFGFESESITTDQLYDLEPQLARIFSGGYRLPQWMTVEDPKKVVTGLVDFCCAKGAEFLCEDVEEFNPNQHSQSRAGQKSIEVKYRSGKSQFFDQVVLAAGVWSKPLLKKMGTPKLVEAERGYNLTYTDPGIDLQRAIMFGDRGVVATPIDHGIRVGGWAEFAGTKRPAKEAHFTAIDNIAAELFPKLNRKENYQWMGHRPSTPDSLPIIERSGTNTNIVYALGHGHLGLTQGPTTAKIVAELLN